MHTPMSISTANARTQPQSYDLDSDQSNSSWAQAISQVMNMLADCQKQYTHDSIVSLRNTYLYRQQKEREAYAGAKADYSAAGWRCVSKLFGAGVSVAGAAFSLYKTAQAGTAFKAGHGVDAEERAVLKNLKATGAEPGAISEARNGVFDRKSEVDHFEQLGRKYQSRADLGRMAEGAAGGLGTAIGEWGSAGNETKSKFHNVAASISDRDADLENEVSRRRRDDSARAISSENEVNQKLAEMARANVSVLM